MRNLLLPLAPWLLVAAAVAALSALFARWEESARSSRAQPESDLAASFSNIRLVRVLPDSAPQILTADEARETAAGAIDLSRLRFVARGIEFAGASGAIDSAHETLAITAMRARWRDPQAAVDGGDIAIEAARGEYDFLSGRAAGAGGVIARDGKGGRVTASGIEIAPGREWKLTGGVRAVFAAADE